MAKLLVIYRKPTNTEQFDDYYRQAHVPLVKKIPGLKQCEISHGPIVSPAGESAFYLVATLTFESMPDLQTAMASPEGLATANDLANFADGGVELLIFEDKVLDLEE